MGGYRERSGRSKTGYNKGYYCGSTYELAFLIWHLDNNVQINRCTKIFEYEFEGKKRKYFPDFEIDSQIYEIKGRIVPVDFIKISVSNAKLIAGNDIKFYLDYVSKMYELNRKSLYKLYDGYKPLHSYKCSNCENQFQRDKLLKTLQVYCSRKCAGIYRKAHNKSQHNSKITCNRQFTKDEALSIFNNNLSCAKLAIQYNTTSANIWFIKAKKTYKWIHK